MDPFNEFDLRSFKIIEILGTSSEIKKHCIGWLISDKTFSLALKALGNAKAVSNWRSRRFKIIQKSSG